MKKTLRKPTPAFVVAVGALVVAMGGTSYAVTKIGSAEIKNGSVRGIDIKNETIQSRDIQDGRILAKDLAPGVLEGATRWVLVNAAGQIEAQSGGFTMAAAYPASVPNTAPNGGDNTGRAAGNVYIDANEDLSDNAIVATIALQNQTDQNGDGVVSGRAAGADANPEFSGEITATRCAIPGVVVCAPKSPSDTNTPEYLVVSPRNSDGSVTTETTRKRFYVVITGG